jgi:hypothetical protein
LREDVQRQTVICTLQDKNDDRLLLHALLQLGVFDA